MYNGIGLTTARGSATSGYVQKNLSHIKPEFFRNKLDANTGRHSTQDRSDAQSTGSLGRKANPDILEHNRKRAIEVQVYELEEKLRDHGYSEQEVAERVKAQREKLENAGDGSSRFSSTDSHATYKRKEEENKKVQAAFGISNDFVEGQSFDREAQAALKARKQQDRELSAKRQKPAPSRKGEDEPRRRGGRCSQRSQDSPDYSYRSKPQVGDSRQQRDVENNKRDGPNDRWEMAKNESTSVSPQKEGGRRLNSICGSVMDSRQTVCRKRDRSSSSSGYESASGDSRRS